MQIISIDDILNIILALLFLIFPTILLSIFLPSALQNYCLTGKDLWSIKSENVPNELIERLYDLKNKEYFFKYKLMSDVESKISNQKLFKKNEKLIENRISKIPNSFFEFFFLGFLIFFYLILFLLSRKLYKL